MSEQPTHHGYAVNVKDHVLYRADGGTLSENEVEAIYEAHHEQFWYDAKLLAQRHGFRAVYSEGHSGGWAVPDPQPSGDMDDAELDAWMRDSFRPFERDVLALLDDTRAEFLGELVEEVARAAAEPAERAHWEARDVITEA